MDLFSVVKLLVDLPEHGLKKGAKGAVVAVFDSPSPAYEVEFCDDAGRTIAQVALTVQQVEEA